MGITDFLTLAIAIWGALIATILGIREIRREKRKLLIILERVYFREVSQLIISNTGYRPVTITNIVMHTSGKQPLKGIGGFIEKLFKKDWYFAQEISSDEMLDGIKLPITLEDSKSVTIKFSQNASDEIIRGEVRVWDSEGREYKINKKRSFNPRFKWYERSR